MTEELDFSELIKFQNQELNRLGWNNDQNQIKQHILRKYGKKSRQLFTDEEMVDFLNYLTSLPTPES